MNFVKLLLLFLTIGLVEPTSALKFAFDGFNTSKLLLYGSAKLDSGAISLTQDTTFSIGRALYHAKIPLRRTNSFETSFTFSITPYKGQLPGHGLVFILVPSAGIQGAAASQHLGFLNRTNDGNPNNNVFGIEFDVFQNQEFNDINNNHVGLNVNSLTSLAAYEAGYWFQDNQNKTNWHFHELKLNNGKIYRVWIDYKDSFLSVSIAPAKMKKPLWPLLNVFIDLSDFFLDEMQGGSKSQRVDLERRGTRESQAIPAPDANAELVLSMQKRKSQYNSKSRSEKFNPHPEEVASGFPIDPPRESQVAESSSGKNTDDAPKISTGADFSSVLVAARRSLLSEIIEKGNVYQMLKDQDLQVQEAVRRGHVDKAKVANGPDGTRHGTGTARVRTARHGTSTSR
ncbi:lectin-like protein [Citrus sinensis]|uniref:lectin-like protein n=1 Tax=Citrus sinensis TaxID=2711 RepID=UPI002278642A|nr:lectin-like protein [Citrus sinensis]